MSSKRLDELLSKLDAPDPEARTLALKETLATIASVAVYLYEAFIAEPNRYFFIERLTGLFRPIAREFPEIRYRPYSTYLSPLPLRLNSTEHREVGEPEYLNSYIQFFATGFNRDDLWLQPQELSEYDEAFRSSTFLVQQTLDLAKQQGDGQLLIMQLLFVFVLDAEATLSSPKDEETEILIASSLLDLGYVIEPTRVLLGKLQNLEDDSEYLPMIANLLANRKVASAENVILGRLRKAVHESTNIELIVALATAFEKLDKEFPDEIRQRFLGADAPWQFKAIVEHPLKKKS